MTDQLPVVSPHLPAEREFHYTDRDFQFVRQQIYKLAGISMNDSKRELVYSRLARRLRALKLKTFQDYFKFLETNAEEQVAFTNALTTNLTYFFREAHHFPVLAEHIAEAARQRGKARVWSAGCSTGEEPYSIAITAMDALGGAQGVARRFELLASDIDTNVLATAGAGMYPVDRARSVPEAVLKQYFQRGKGANEGRIRVTEPLRRMIEFIQVNLLEDHWPGVEGCFDAIFCRNVMIYFDKDTQHKILERFSRRLRPDGLLFAGHSESFFHAADLFVPMGRTVYRLAQPLVERQRSACH